MPRELGPSAIVGWLKAPDGTLAGAAFLIGPDVALTCAHVIRDHLQLGRPTPAHRPDAKVTIRFEGARQTVEGSILPSGWFPDVPAEDEDLADIAVIRLDRRLDGPPMPALARMLSNVEFEATVFGSEPGYQEIGQQASVKVNGTPSNRGWRQLDSDGGGFAVERGFSGAPAMDARGNTVWGMVTTVDAKERKVSFAITAHDLRSALERAGADLHVRISDDVDALARQALDGLLASHESEKAALKAESGREIERLREA
ncbi:MAG: trypsin-like peptidase domain-containing protein, partial [Acetobacteraceae bacterium]|nr:trypsin-like peptidase domain-containing protein [Acetobacteraceae bacterium]